VCRIPDNSDLGLEIAFLTPIHYSLLSFDVIQPLLQNESLNIPTIYIINRQLSYSTEANSAVLHCITGGESKTK
jgi:hypothetical protein